MAVLEDLGDAYASDGDHRAAMKNFQSAFDLCARDIPARTRLAFKVGRSAFHRGIGTDADAWFNVPLEKSVPATVATPGVAHLHLQQIRAMWSSSRTADVVALSEGLLDAATRSGDADLVLATRLSLATVLHLLARHAEAERHLRTIDPGTLPHDDKVLCMYYRAYGMAYTSVGNADMALESFAKALHHAENDRDVYATTSILTATGVCANALGRIDLAGASFSQALSVARDNNLFWNAAYISLEYARIVGRQGNRHLAHAYVVQASTFENAPPVLVEALAEIGIPIAIESGDAHLLERCANGDALTFAFRSGEPPRLGQVASSFARYHVANGRRRAAEELLARAFTLVKSVDHNYELTLAAAEFGAVAERTAARELLRVRAQLPNAEVAVAHLHYFDAVVSRREGDAPACLGEATTAARLFANMGWSSLHTAANALCDAVARDRKGRTQSGEPVSAISVELTRREKTVARLAVAGFSNQEIADALAISARTVESHMTSILRRTGLQSRHQLLGALSG